MKLRVCSPRHIISNPPEHRPVACFLSWEQMEQIGCRIHFMAGDGNCLFRSLGDQVEGKPQDHAEIRAQVRKDTHIIVVLILPASLR